MLYGYRVSVWDDEALDMDSGVGCRTLRMYLIPFNCLLQNG